MSCCLRVCLPVASGANRGSPAAGSGAECGDTCFAGSSGSGLFGSAAGGACFCTFDAGGSCSPVPGGSCPRTGTAIVRSQIEQVALQMPRKEFQLIDRATVIRKDLLQEFCDEVCLRPSITSGEGESRLGVLVRSSRL